MLHSLPSYKVFQRMMCRCEFCQQKTSRPSDHMTNLSIIVNLFKMVTLSKITLCTTSSTVFKLKMRSKKNNKLSNSQRKGESTHMQHVNVILRLIVVAEEPIPNNTVNKSRQIRSARESTPMQYVNEILRLTLVAKGPIPNPCMN